MELIREYQDRYSWYDETSNNIHYYNGWKTNKAWIVNRKVIILLHGWNSWGDFRPTDWEVVKKLADVEKCFNYLAGKSTASSNLSWQLRKEKETEQSRNIELKYFKVTFYKKGTCHITFSNEELWKKFNIFGSQRKGWSPPGYGKKEYKEMSPEEKAVIDDFEGEAEYSKVFASPDDYLFNTSNMTLLESREEQKDGKN